MKVVSATNARSALFKMMKEVNEKHCHFHITSKNGSAVLLSEEDFEAIIETLDILSAPGARKKIQQAEKDIATGNTFSLEEVFGE